MSAFIQITQWREPFDDEDSLELYAYADDTGDPLADIRTASQIPTPDNLDAVDEDGCIIVTNELRIDDGQVIEHNGRKFLISITEVK